jgi:hypothetical protein
LSNEYLNFVITNHNLYNRYYDDWRLCLNSWYGGVEYKNAKYLRAYAVDMATPGETINTYITGEDGVPIGKSQARLQLGTSTYDTDKESSLNTGNFYKEKLDNTPLYNYVKLISAEYNALLFRNPPQRYVGESPEAAKFLQDVDGEGNSINEFMSQVDLYTTVMGVCHVTCIKPIGSDIPRWRIHTPLDVTNWKYKYDIDGNLVLTDLVILLEKTDYHSVYRYFTANEIHTIFVGADDKKDYTPPIDDPRLEQIDDLAYRIVQPNELGYVPVQTFYQSTKIYNNVGTTVIQDVAQIQRSIYGDMAEIYSAITYSAHPTLVVDENTDQLNDGQVGGEPGSIVKVQSSLTGTPTHVFEFKAPSLDSIAQIRELVDNKVQKLSQIAMLRSEDLIKAANSGAQIEVYDDKLSAMVRRKATNLENGEAKLWEIWFDWLNMPIPEDFSISYNRQYNRRALEIELKEVDLMIATLEKYQTMVEGPPEEEEKKMPEELPNIPGRTYADGEPIPATLPALYVEAGLPGTMPGQNCSNCEYYAGGMCGKFQAPVRENYWCAKWEDAAEEMAEDKAEEKVDMQEEQEELAYEEFKTNARNKIRERLEQLFNASTTDNGF